MKKRIIYLLYFILFGSILAKAQNPETGFQHKVGFSVFEEHINLPFRNRLGEKRHWGSTVSYGISKPRNGVYQFAHNFNLGYFHHQEFFHAFFLRYQAGFALEFGKVLEINLPIGLGYATSFSTQQGFSFLEGEYHKTNTRFKNHFQPSVGLGSTLKLEKIIGIPIEVFGQYECFSLMPYAPKGNLPFTVHTALSLGLKYRIK